MLLESDWYLTHPRPFQFGFKFSNLSVDALLDVEDKLAINRPSFSQTLCTVLQIAICDLYEYIGLLPAAVVGHSSGEIGAA